MYWAYIIQNQKGERYTGSTADLDGRIKIHNDTDTTRNEVLRFERFLKTGKGRNWVDAFAVANNDKVLGPIPRTPML